MTSEVFTKSLYVLFGTLCLVAAAAALLFRTGLLPDVVKKIVFDAAHGDLNAVHISQEFASLLVFAGLITFWFARDYQQSLFFHWAMTTFWGLFALVHWFDVRGPIRWDLGVLINAIPFILFLSVGLVTRNRKMAKWDNKR